MGFEPTVFYNTPVFKTGTLSRSVIHPKKIFMNNLLLYNHFKEIKFRLSYTFVSFLLLLIIFYIFSLELIYISIKPLLIILKDDMQTSQLMYTNITEVFFSFFYLTIVSAIFFNIPLLVYHFYYFILPGIYNNEQKKLIYFILFIIIYFLINSLFIYSYLIPSIWSFFLSYEIKLNSEIFQFSFQGKLNEYINLFLDLITTFLILSQIPIVCFLLLYFNIIKITTIIKSRKINIIGCFILGALLSPPDVFSQIIIAIPLCFFYEIIIILGLFLNNKKLLFKNNLKKIKQIE